MAVKQQNVSSWVSRVSCWVTVPVTGHPSLNWTVWRTGTGLVEGHQGNWGWHSWVCGSRVCSAFRREDQGEVLLVSAAAPWGLQMRWSQTLLRDAHGKDKWQWTKAETREITIRN